MSAITEISSYGLVVSVLFLSPFPWCRIIVHSTDAIKEAAPGGVPPPSSSTSPGPNDTTVFPTSPPTTAGNRTAYSELAGSFSYFYMTGAVVLVIIILAGLIIAWRKNKSDSIDPMKRNQLIVDEQEFKYGKPLDEGPDYSIPADSATKLLLIPYDTRLEIPRKDVNLSNATLLGTGNFGKVLKGKIGKRPVAVKMLLPNPDYPHFKAMLSELKIMSYVGEHENIVKLERACTDHVSFKKMDILLIFEFCELGNAHTFIKDRRDSFVNMIREDRYVRDYNTVVTEYSNAITSRLNSQQLLKWCVEVANGMEHLASKNVYHGDLASRNILLDGRFTAKIGDFGLSRQLYEYSTYVQSKECPLPLKWMAIESLRDLEFSIISDVWSFGIMMWEFFSLATVPYPGVDWNFEAWKYLSEGNRMECPEHAITSVYTIMMQCWEAKPECRPTFSELKELLENELLNIG